MEVTQEEKKLYDILSELEIKYTKLPHKVIKTMEEGKAIMKKLEGNVCINLLLKGKNGKLYLVVKKVGGKVDTKKLGKSLNTKLGIAPMNEMTTILGVPEGCATVFAVKNNVDITVLIDRTLEGNKVNFHPMRNDATITIEYNDMIKYIVHYHNPIIYF